MINYPGLENYQAPLWKVVIEIDPVENEYVSGVNLKTGKKLNADGSESILFATISEVELATREAKRANVYATVLAIGPLAFKRFKDYYGDVGEFPKVGDKVLCQKYGGEVLKPAINDRGDIKLIIDEDIFLFEKQSRK